MGVSQHSSPSWNPKNLKNPSRDDPAKRPKDPDLLQLKLILGFPTSTRKQFRLCLNQNVMHPMEGDSRNRRGLRNLLMSPGLGKPSRYGQVQCQGFTIHPTFPASSSNSAASISRIRTDFPLNLDGHPEALNSKSS